MIVREISQPDQGRLRKLMPPIPDFGRTRWSLLVRQQLAPLVALLAILLSGWFWQTGPAMPLSAPSSTPLMEAVILTGAPTSTSMQIADDDGESLLFTIAARASKQQEVTVTPAPHPTPP